MYKADISTYIHARDSVGVRRGLVSGKRDPLSDIRGLVSDERDLVIDKNDLVSASKAVRCK